MGLDWPLRAGSVMMRRHERRAPIGLMAPMGAVAASKVRFTRLTIIA